MSGHVPAGCQYMCNFHIYRFDWRRQQKCVICAFMLDPLHPLLAALARLMVAKGVPFTDLAERLKAHYVAAALERGEGKPTDSRLSVQTGLQRRDIARLRASALKPPKLSHLARLVNLWRTDPAYLTAQGTPRPLPRSGPAPSFDSLARDVRTDIHPRTQLDALLAAGTAQLNKNTDEVTLIAEAYIPSAGTDDQLAYLAANTGDHLAAATQNVLGREAPFFERALHYGELSEAEVNALEAQFQSDMMTLLETLRDRAAQMKRQSPRPDPAHAQRFRAGGFAYRAPEASE